METQNRGSDELNWKLAGIRDEKRHIEERLNYLRDEERRLTGQGLTGQAKNSGKAASAAKGGSKGGAKSVAKRTRNLTEETRQKMRDAAKKRWADDKKKKEGTAEQVAPPAEATPVDAAAQA